MSRKTSTARKPKRVTRREPTPEEEGAQILANAEKAGANYAQDQVDGSYFRDWVMDQMVEGEEMRKRDPNSVIPLETPSDAKKLARNMLQQLEWDTKRDMDASTILELSGAKGVFDSGSEDWVRDTYGITYEEVRDAFFSAFDEALESQRQWLTDMILENLDEVRGTPKSEPPRSAKAEEVRRSRFARTSVAEKDVMILTHDGAWKHERVPARVGMIVRVYLGSDRSGHPRSGADDYIITRVDPKHNRIATKLAHHAGGETWGDANGYLAMRPHSSHVDPQTWAEHRRVVRDYIAVDPRGRTVAGPFTDYSDAKQAATRARGFVKFASGARESSRRRTR